MTKAIHPDRSDDGRSPTHRSLLEERTTRRVIGAFFTVYNDLGYGFLESVYRNALLSELSARGMHAESEVPIEVAYKGRTVGSFRADVLVERSVLLELKAAQSVGIADRRQLLNYLKATRIDVGLILHFGPRASFQRVIRGWGAN